MCDQETNGTIDRECLRCCICGMAARIRRRDGATGEVTWECTHCATEYLVSPDLWNSLPSAEKLPLPEVSTL